MTQNFVQTLTNAPPITLLLLTYNQAKFVKESVTAALRQDYSNLQIVISDDCSEDHTFNIVKELTSAYTGPHSVVINQNKENLGLIRHIQDAVAKCNGSFIVMNAGDDISADNRCTCIAEAITQIEDLRAVAVATSSVPLTETAPNAFTGKKKYEIVPRNKVYIQPGILGPGAALAYHREVFTAFPRLSDKLICEDHVLPFRAAILGNVVRIKSNLLYKQPHQGSLNTANQRLIKSDSTLTFANRKRITLSLADDVIHARKKKFITPGEAEKITEYLSLREKRLDRGKDKRASPLALLHRLYSRR